jgi:hypothetical protein
MTRDDWKGHRPSRYTGIDPSLVEGAVSVLDERGHLIGAGVWSRFTLCKAYRYRVRAWLADEGTVEGHLPYRQSAVGRWLAEALEPAMAGPFGSVLAIEDNHVGVNARSAVLLAQSTGMVLGPFQEVLDVSGHAVQPNSWRSAIYPKGWAKVPAPPRGQKALSKRAHLKAQSLKWIPRRVPGLDVAQLALDATESDHLTESAGVASWLRAQALVW